MYVCNFLHCHVDIKVNKMNNFYCMIWSCGQRVIRKDEIIRKTVSEAVWAQGRVVTPELCVLQRKWSSRGSCHMSTSAIRAVFFHSSTPSTSSGSSAVTPPPARLPQPADMAKSSSRKSLKSLFSRSEASLAAPAEKDVDKNEGERKRFKFLKFKMKSKNSSASVKPANENQQLHRYARTMSRFSCLRVCQWSSFPLKLLMIQFSALNEPTLLL